MEVHAIRTPSLGDATYVLSHGGYAVVVDPQRDIDRFLDVIEADRLAVTHVLETHMHNDYISGGKDLAERTNADLVIPAAAGATFSFVPAFHHQDLEGEAGLTIRPIHTPGHTLAHTSYLVLLEGVPHAVFTGGSLLVGAAGRSDLLGEDLAHQLAVLQYGSLQRLAELPDETGVYPTHGEGSFCTASGAGRTTSTIKQEKAENPLYEFEDAESFAKNQLAGLVPYPSYYAFMGPANKLGPSALATPTVPELNPYEVASAMKAGAAVLDGRNRYAFAAGHVKGALGVEVGDSFAPWAGWLLDYNTELVLVLDEDQDEVLAATELGRIGFERIKGVMRGIAGWRDAHMDVASHETADIKALVEAQRSNPAVQVLDVRDPLEWDAGHLPGTLHCYVPDINGELLSDLETDRPVWVVCRSGNRASIAAARLERLGLTPIVVAKGGVPDALATQAVTASLDFLVGTWKGQGHGDYPTIEGFDYTEEVTFAPVPMKPFLTYSQRTKGSDGQPLHSETGYVRPVGDGEAELIVAQPIGITEIHTGGISNTSIEFVAQDVGRSPTAKEVRAVRRHLRVDGDVLTYQLDMAAVGHDLQFHLEATLHRVKN